MNPITSDYDPLKVLYGTHMTSMWSPSSVARADKEGGDVIGLVVSEDELLAYVDVRAGLIQRLKFIPREHLEAQLTSSKGELLVQIQGVITHRFIDPFPCMNI
jgi:hypothetical protein